MKENWTYKKLGEVAAFIGDGDWIESRHQSELGIRLIQTGNIGNGVFKAKEDKPHYISEQTFNELDCTEIYSGDCLVSRLPDPIGRACIIPEIGCRMITAVDCTIIRFNEILYPQFFVYYTGSKEYEREIRNHATGSTRKRISRKNLELVKIPVPSLETQQHIISELDLLQSIIDKQKAQLMELDNLAQAVFYDMFGDPVENEKGWEVKKLGEICSLKAGKAIKASELSDNIAPSLFPCYGGNGVRGYINKYSHAESYPIVGRQGALCGNVNFAEAPFYATEHAVVVKPIKNINSKWLFFQLKAMRLNQYAHGVAQPGLAVQDLEPLDCILPPLSLQQSFAAKIESIEKQKAAITQSIAETQRLFDFTMDKYFG